uniref:Capsid protein n=1 Tax=Wenling crossorhombus astrovirus 1 TaxID=2116117 RepID=A0A2P1GMY8_9VIRU|nr:capsid protein [Wenling crossorhombus astrovirus 1]
MSGQPITKREQKARAAALRKGETFDPSKLKKKTAKLPAKRANAPKRNNGGKRQPWGTATPRLPPGMSKDYTDCFNMVVGKVKGTDDDWGNPIAIPCNPRALSALADAPKLRVTSSMYQKYRLKHITIDATPLVSAAGVAGTVLMVSEGGSANSPTPPENVNTCKERNGATCAIGDKLTYKYVPPTRQYLTRPDGDVSETTPGFIFVSTYLPTTSVLSATKYTGPLWIISVSACFEFSVFEDPVKNVEDSVISEPLLGDIRLEQDETGTPMLTGEGVSYLTTKMHAVHASKISKNAKNGILLATGIIASASAAIPGPLGILVRAGCLIVKLVMAKIPASSGVGASVLKPALQIHGSVDDALENRPVYAPGLDPISLRAEGSITTITVGQNPITASPEGKIDVDTPHVHAPTATKGYIGFLPFVQEYPKWTPGTASTDETIYIDNIGQYTIGQSHNSIASTTFPKMKVIVANPDGNVVYEGPVAGCPTNGTHDGKRILAWVVKQNSNPGDNTSYITWVFWYEPAASKYYYACTKDDTTKTPGVPSHYWNGYTGIARSLTPAS